MTIVDAAHVPLLNRPRSLPRFLPLWSASYLAPCLAAWTVVTVVAMWFPPNNDNPTLFRHVATAVWIFLWPAGLALGQWMLMRHYLPSARFWALAIFAGALFQRVSGMFMPHASAGTVGSMPPLGIAAHVLTIFAVDLCLGAAWSVPSAFALPGTRSARVTWVIALTLTIVGVRVMDAFLARELETQFLGSYPKINYPIGDLFPLIAAHAVPALLGWLIVSFVSGSLMYWNLRRNSAAGFNQVYASFD